MDALGWLGMRQVDDTRWCMEVTDAVVAGSSALYGGCATAASVAVAAGLCDHTPRWAATHFTGLAQRGSTVTLSAAVVTAGRTVTHVAVQAVGETDRPCFTSRVMLGDRPPLVPAPSRDGESGDGESGDGDRPAAATGPGAFAPPVACSPFDIASHRATFADRFEWRLADAGGRGQAAWWVRAHDRPLDGALLGALLSDYLTYGIGRAGGHDVGGLSVDNVLRIHERTPVDGWALLVVTPDSFDGGFASGTARVWREDGTLLATGSQTMILNPWNWRQADE